MLPLAILALFVASPLPTLAQAPGSIVEVGSTLVSAMMLFLGNDEKVYILDKSENNPTQINGHPAFGAVWDIATNTATPMDVLTNTFCSSGIHLPNGSFATFGGNMAVGPTGAAGDTGAGAFDTKFGDYDGRKAIRVLNPCTGPVSSFGSNCQWFDNSTVLAMQKLRWYSTAEALADGSVVLIGGFVNGGYINRNTINSDPAYEGGGAEPTYEFYPSNGRPATVMQFMVATSGLNAYAHAFLMPSGKMFVQANISTIMWDYNANIETPLPPMPGNVVRVYPASGAVAMLPLTPANDYTPTVLFCGGSDMDEHAWGNYSNPFINTWDYPASKDCQQITPEPTDGTSPVYVQDDDMLEGRSMGQFIILPDQTLLVINGAVNGTAGYATATGETPLTANMPFGMSLASGPVLTPAIYTPTAPKGKRWSRTGLQQSQIPRMYHSSALLLPDASVLVAGSNPNVDYNATTVFSTEYRAEIFYPSYFGATRPSVQGIPTSLSYGGTPFDLTVSSDSYAGKSNDAAAATTVVIVRPGFTTHAMNMGQRLLQLNNTYTVDNDGTIHLHVAQVPPNPNLITPGPVLLFVVVNGIPSIGKIVSVGNGQIGTQPTSLASVLPPSTKGSATASGSGTSSTTKPKSSVSMTVIAIAAIGVVVLLGLIGGGLYWMRKRGRNAAKPGAAGTVPNIYHQTHMESRSQVRLTSPSGEALASPMPFRNAEGFGSSTSFFPGQQPQKNRSMEWQSGPPPRTPASPSFEPYDSPPQQHEDLSQAMHGGGHQTNANYSRPYNRY